MTTETKNLVPEISPNGKRLNICEYKGTYIYSEPSNERSLEPNLHFFELFKHKGMFYCEEDDKVYEVKVVNNMNELVLVPEWKSASAYEEMWFLKACSSARMEACKLQTVDYVETTLKHKFGYLFTVKTRDNKILYRYLANNHGGMFDWDTEKECSSHIVRRQHLSVPEMYLD